jgi:hypothetical protein
MLSDADVALFDALSQHLKDIKLIDQNVHGYVNTLKNLEELMVDLRLRTGVHFATRHSRTNKRAEIKVCAPEDRLAVLNEGITHSTRFLWQLKGKVGIPELTCPFSSGKYFLKECEHGKRYQINNKRPLLPGQRSRKRTSKKQNCPASLQVKEVLLFPEYSISEEDFEKNDYQKRTAKLVAIQALKRDLLSKKNVLRKYRYYVSIPLVCAHNHECIVTHPLHPLILQKLD